MQPTPQLITQIVQLTGIDKLCETVLSLALTHSVQSEQSQYAKEHLKLTFPALIERYLSVKETTAAAGTDISIVHTSGLHNIYPDLLQLLISSFESYISEDARNNFLNKLREQYPRNCVPLVLAPYLYRCAGIDVNEAVDTEDFETGIEEIYENICETIFTSQVIYSYQTNIFNNDLRFILRIIYCSYFLSIEKCTLKEFVSGRKVTFWL